MPHPQDTHTRGASILWVRAFVTGLGWGHQHLAEAGICNEGPGGILYSELSQSSPSPSTDTMAKDSLMSSLIIRSLELSPRGRHCGYGDTNS